MNHIEHQGARNGSLFVMGAMALLIITLNPDPALIVIYVLIAFSWWRRISRDLRKECEGCKDAAVC